MKHFLRTAWTKLAPADGQTMAEYGVVIAVITLGVIVAISLLSAAISGKLGAVTALFN